MRTGAYLYDRDILLTRKEVKIYFGKQLEVDSLLKSQQIRSVQIDGKKYYKLKSILKTANQFLK